MHTLPDIVYLSIAVPCIVPVSEVPPTLSFIAYNTPNVYHCKVEYERFSKKVHFEIHTCLYDGRFEVNYIYAAHFFAMYMDLKQTAIHHPLP